MRRLPLLLCALSFSGTASAVDSSADPFESGALESRSWFEAQVPAVFDSDGGCIGSEDEPSSGVQVAELSDTQRLALLLCEQGPDNVLYTPLLAERIDNAWEWRIVELSLCGTPASRLANPVWQPAPQALAFFAHENGTNDCGVRGAVEWDGDELSGGWCRRWDDCEHPIDERWPLTFGEESEYLPPAFTAEELAIGIVGGEHYVYQVDTPEGSTQAHMIFASPDDEAVTVVTWEVADKVATDPVEAVVRWDDLATHSVYLRDGTTQRETTCQTGIGALEGTAYRVVTEDGTIVDACFASQHPGPPVRFTRETDGVILFGMVLIAHEIAPIAP